MNDDVAATNCLIHTIIVDDDLIAAIFIPNPYAEGIFTRAGFTAATPEHELEGITIGINDAVNGAFTLEPGVVAAGDDRPFIAAAVEVQVTRFELEFRVPVGNGSALLVLGYKAEFKLCNEAERFRSRSSLFLIALS